MVKLENINSSLKVLKERIVIFKLPGILIGTMGRLHNSQQKFNFTGFLMERRKLKFCNTNSNRMLERIKVAGYETKTAVQFPVRRCLKFLDRLGDTVYLFPKSQKSLYPTRSISGKLKNSLYAARKCTTLENSKINFIRLEI